MLTPQCFALVNLAIWVAVLAAIVVLERRGRQAFHSHHRGVRYRRMTTAMALKLIRKADGN